MTEVNILKLVKEHFLSPDFTDSPYVGVSDGDFNLENIKLKVRKIEWSDMTQPRQEVDHSVNISKAPSSPSGEAQIRTQNGSDFTCRVIIDSGLIKGINASLKLELPKENPEVLEEFGEFIKINPGKAQQEEEDTITVAAAMEQPLVAGGATANLRFSKMEYAGQFVCTVAIKGIAIQRQPGGVLQDQFCNVISNLKRKNKTLRDDLDALSLKKNEVWVTIKGEAVFHWGHDQTIEMKNSQ